MGIDTNLLHESIPPLPADRVFGLTFRSRFGWIAASARGGRLTAVTLPHTTAHQARAAVDPAADYGTAHPLLIALCEDLRRFFAGEQVGFRHYPLDLDSQPPFRRSALLAARRIPYGETWTYLRLAAEAGNPRAARAAGQAMANNPFAFVVPCHRVIASDGSSRGYAGGLTLKQFLLHLEAHPSKPPRVQP